MSKKSKLSLLVVVIVVLLVCSVVLILYNINSPKSVINNFLSSFYFADKDDKRYMKLESEEDLIVFENITKDFTTEKLFDRMAMNRIVGMPKMAAYSIDCNFSVNDITLKETQKNKFDYTAVLNVAADNGETSNCLVTGQIEIVAVENGNYLVSVFEPDITDASAFIQYLEKASYN